MSNSLISDTWGNGIEISNSSPTITGNTVTASTYIGISISNSNAVVTNNTISNNGGYGINVGSVYGSPASASVPVITGNTITGNTGYGLYYLDDAMLNATNNNWGDLAGPLDDSDDRATGGFYNPTGKGNKVSNNVNYFPRTGTTITQTTTPAGLTSIPRYASINLTWDSSSEPSFNGYKIYYGTAAGSYGTPILTGKITSYKLTGLSNGTPYFIAISSVNSVGAESELTPEISATPVNQYAIDLTIVGTGKGNVLFSQGGTACNTNCSVLFDPFTTVTLQDNTEEYSLFKGWSGACTAASGDCQLTMDADKTISATFDKDNDHSVRIDLPTLKYYPSISATYLDPAATSLIKVWGTEFSGNITFSENKAVKIKGGYNSGYTTNTGTTVLQGTMRIRKGTVRVENLIVG